MKTFGSVMFFAPAGYGSFVAIQSLPGLPRYIKISSK